MRRSFLSNLFFLLFINFLVKPFWILGIDRTVQNAAGPEDYGIYFSLFNFTILFQVLLDFGINNFNNRHIARYPERLHAYLSTMLSSKLLFALVYAVVVWAVAFGIGLDGTRLGLLALLMVNQVLMSFLTYLRSNISALQLFRTDALLSVMDKLLTSAFCAVVLWTDWLPLEMSITLFVLAQIGGYGLTCILAWILMPIGKWDTWSKLPDRTLLQDVVKQSAPFALLTFLMATYYRIDGVMLERLLKADGPMQAGIYASAFRILDALNIIGYLFAAILLPSFSRLLEKKLPVQSIFDSGLKTILTISLPAATVLFAFRNPIMSLLYTDANSSYGAVFGLLMAGFVPASLAYIYGTFLTAGGALRQLNWIAVGGVVLNIALNLLLIPRYQAYGAAIATLATQGLVTLLQATIVYRSWQIHFTGDIAWRLLAYLIISVGIARIMSEWLPFPWFISMLTAIAVVVAGALILKLVSLKEWKDASLLEESGSR